MELPKIGEAYEVHTPFPACRGSHKSWDGGGVAHGSVHCDDICIVKSIEQTYIDIITFVTMAGEEYWTTVDRFQSCTWPYADGNDEFYEQLMLQSAWANGGNQ